MKPKRIASVLLSTCFLTSALSSFVGCASSTDVVLRVYSWEEYIDDGGEGSFIYDQLHEEDENGEIVEIESEIVNEDYKARYLEMTGTELDPEGPSVIDDFELWYKKQYGKSVRVEYSTFGTNEDLYNQLKLGNTYDLVCPSDYMIMKLAAEGMLEPLSDEEDFYNKDNEQNYYANYVSPYIESVFENGKLTVPVETIDENGKKTVTHEERRWSEYAAGYMWGTTGLIYNPKFVSEDDLNEKGWGIMLDEAYKKKVTTKDNVRDSYFVGLAICYQEELYALQAQLNANELTNEEYNEKVTEIMNRTDEESVEKVQSILLEMKKNIFGFETDTGKADMVKGTIWMNFAWSGDAVYAIDLAEEDGLELNYFIPGEGSNLWFDGWAIPKDNKRSDDRKHAAKAFINFMSKPENAVRNMYYIGYTSAIAGDEVYDYVADTYSADEDAEETVPYDISYFFGEEKGSVIIDTTPDQIKRQLYAQYPTEEVTHRCAVMDYYGDRDARINELWTKVKGASLDVWAIVVLAVAALLIIAFILFKQFGHKIELPRKVKKGYKLVKQEKA